MWGIFPWVFFRNRQRWETRDCVFRSTPIGYVGICWKLNMYREQDLQFLKSFIYSCTAKCFLKQGKILSMGEKSITDLIISNFSSLWTMAQLLKPTQPLIRWNRSREAWLIWLLKRKRTTSLFTRKTFRSMRADTVVSTNPLQCWCVTFARSGFAMEEEIHRAGCTSFVSYLNQLKASFFLQKWVLFMCFVALEWEAIIVNMCVFLCLTVLSDRFLPDCFAVFFKNNFWFLK